MEGFFSFRLPKIFLDLLIEVSGNVSSYPGPYIVEQPADPILDQIPAKDRNRRRKTLYKL